MRAPAVGAGPRDPDAGDMAAPHIDPTPAPEVPLLGVFAALIIVGVVAISLVIAIPSYVTLAVAMLTVLAAPALSPTCSAA